MKDSEKGKAFYDLQHSELFKAQLELEEQQLESLHSRFLAIDPKSNVEFEYARVRGSLEALKALKATRELLIQEFRSRNPNS